ncbi:MAG: histidine--tRNA ligase [Methanosarcinales archaeon]
MKIKKPRGTRDFLPEETLTRNFIKNKMVDLAQRWGYKEIKTPTFEHLELFTIKSGEAIIEEIYDFVDKGGRHIALRPELTAPVMRMYVNELQVAPKPLKFYYFENCFRYERPQKGRFREFWQFGVELIGSPRAEADAEVIALADTLLNEVGIKGDLHIGHLGILRSLLKDINPEVQSNIMRLVDKKNYKGLKDFLEEINTPEELQDSLFNLITLTGPSANCAHEIIGNIKELKEFEEILQLVDLYNIDYTIDFGIARGLDYYTGMVFEIYAEGLGAQNQVCGGGSYQLAHLFGGKKTASTGFAIGFDRVMEICKLSPKENKKVFVVCTENTRKEAIKIAKELRKYVITDIDVMGRNFSAQMKYANTIGADYAVIVGEEELKKNKITLKNMETGEQELMELKKAIEYISTRQ